MTFAASPSEPIIRLASSDTELILQAAIGDSPRVLYFGPTIKGANAGDLMRLSTTQKALGAPDINVPPSLSLEAGLGVNAPFGLEAHRDGGDWALKFRVAAVEWVNSHSVRLHCEDTLHGVELVYALSAVGQGGCFAVSTSITNRHDLPLSLDWLASVVLPLPQGLQEFIGFSGRWSQEFQTEQFTLSSGSYVRDNRAGRTSHESPPFLIAKTATTSEYQGACLGLHLGWSGNHRLRLDRHNNGAIYAQMGALFFPGEMRLGKGAAYTTPTLYMAQTHEGLNALSQIFHGVVGDNILDKRTQNKPRPVHYNTWEAVYFDHSEARLMALADRAADIGAERFVLDDGWFGGRRHDAAGLGDWVVSTDVYPDGLEPLADHVRAVGMEFGLWFEPEMVNPDSDLFRAHPDWVLGVAGVETIPYRNQYILDLTRPEVCGYLFGRIETLVKALGVGYIKWDMNRDNSHPGGQDGRSIANAQTLAVYGLIARLRDAFPELEIESCSSGGGRADFEILRHTDRVWTSDNNDAMDRQTIQRGASHFFPLKVTGSHVGPKTCHITGRVFDMKMRVASAIFGHMGIEADLSLETDADLQTLKAGVSLYKTHRALLHSGDFYRLETPSYLNAVGVVAKDKHEALVSCVKTAHHKGILPYKLQFVGLNSSSTYRVRLVWPEISPALTSPSIIDVAGLCGDGLIVSGDALMLFGMQLPLTFLDVGLIFHLEVET